MVKKLHFILILIFISYKSINSQIITAHAYTDKSTYEVGDYINYTIEISHDQNLQVFKPILSDYAKNIEVLKSEEQIFEDAKGSKRILFKFIISKYDSGDVVVPQIPVFYHLSSDTTSLSIFTNSVQFTVSTLPVNTSEEIKDVKPPMTIPMDLLTLIIILSIIIIVLLLALYYYKKNQKKKQRQATRTRIYIIPPHVKALSELQALEDKKLWQQGLIKEYHSNITEIIRKYFEERFQILALESSTSELMEQLIRVVLSEQVYKMVREFLGNADLVKFAKYKPLPSINEEMMKQAIDIVENTVPVVESISKEKVNV